jgi:hypothetical protein
VRADEPEFIALRTDIGLTYTDVTITDGLDLSAQERQSSLDCLQDVVVVCGLSVNRDCLFAHATELSTKPISRPAEWG